MTTLPAETALLSPAQYQDAVQCARQCAALYYGDGDSPLDDTAYDLLLRSIAGWERAHPDQVSPDSPTEKVGAGTAPVGDVAHTAIMLSLDNVFDGTELMDWEASLVRRTGRAVRDGFTVEPKLDGVAVCARYRDGRLVQLVTRGDGRSGEDVSHVIGTVIGLPPRLEEAVTFEARGEVLFTREQFAEANRVRERYRAKPFANPRNGAAGTVRAKDRPYRLEMSFYAYGAVELGGSFLRGAPTHAEVMARVARAGVQTTAATDAGLRLCASVDEVQRRVEEIGTMRGGLAVEIDGVVVKANSLEDHTAAGSGSRFPYFAVAYKLPAERARTRLLGVEWNAGRFYIAPRALLEPVFVGGATITSATLHNWADIGKRGLRIGDVVEVYRAAEVIPRVEAPVVELRTGQETEIPEPVACPSCGGAIDKSEERWRCADGVACGLPAALLYAAGREQLDVDGIGPGVVNALVGAGAVGDVADLFALTVEQLSLAAGSDKRGATVYGQIQAAKSRPLNKVLCALGVKGTGRSISRRMAAHFGTMDAIRAADAAALEGVEGIGAEKAVVIAARIAALGPVIDKLAAAGVNLTEPVRESGPDSGGRPLAGQSVVCTGTMTGPLESYSRAAMNELVERAGGTPSGSVSAKTSLVVAGGKAGSKKAKAESLGIKVLSPEEFAVLVADHLS
ncbi:NAD-dependent DNA ligase LigA [Streptomyces sp. NPDC058953]|uniref:NAD-dependent DNA ligase LigA n=1 Tax=unclassified Streptomyces TaxID=2593676 RepID=UPI0036A1AC32